MTCFSLQTAVIFLYWLALTCQLHLVLLTLGVLSKSPENYERLSDSALAQFNSYSTQHAHFISSRNCSFNCIVSFMGYAPGCILYAKLLSIYMWNGGGRGEWLTHKARPGFIIPVIFTINSLQSCSGKKKMYMSSPEVDLTNAWFLTKYFQDRFILFLGIQQPFFNATSYYSGKTPIFTTLYLTNPKGHCMTALVYKPKKFLLENSVFF